MVKARFGARQPLVQISDPMKADIRINRSTEASAAPVDSILTVSDIQRYGPGIVVDYGVPGKFRVLVWVE